MGPKTRQQEKAESSQQATPKETTTTLTTAPVTTTTVDPPAQDTIEVQQEEPEATQESESEEDSEDDSEESEEEKTPSGSGPSALQPAKPAESTTTSIPPKKPSPPPPPPSDPSNMATEMPEIKGYKPIAPKPYDGTTDVDAFLIHARLYLKFYSSSLKDDVQKILAISQLLSGKVLEWFQPILKDFLEDTLKTEEAKHVFGLYANFEEKLRTLFGEPKKAEHAEKQLHRLRQTKSASDYAVEFKRLASISGLPEEALFHPFYQGLKTQVQDELAKEGRTKTFNEYVEKAILHDRRSFERYLEKRGPSKNKKEQNDRPQGNKGQKSKEANAVTRNPPKDKSQVECFNCGKKGHYKSECRSKKPEYQKGKIPQPKKKVRVVEIQDDEEQDHSSDEDESSEQEFTVAVLRQETSPEPDTKECDVCQETTFRACKYHPGEFRSRAAIELGCTCYLQETGCRLHPEETFHENLHWSFCKKYNCHYHQQAKDNAGYDPADDSDTDESEEDPCNCYRKHPKHPYACPVHPDTAKSRQAIQQGCMCYTHVICELHEPGTPVPSEKQDKGEGTSQYQPDNQEPDILQELLRAFPTDCKIGKRKWYKCQNDHCQKHAAKKARAWRIAQTTNMSKKSKNSKDARW